MTSEKERGHRLTVDITEYQYQKLRQHIEHGMQKKVFSIIIDDIILMYEIYGGYFTAAMIEKQVTYKNLMEVYCNQHSGVPNATQGSSGD